MNPTISKLAVYCTLLLGVAVWGNMAMKFDAGDKLSYEPNVACIKGSPYGKILALAMQGPIDFYWHQGKTHDDEIILAAGGQHHHGHDHDCDHDHGHDLHAACEEDCGGHHDHAGHDHHAESNHGHAHPENCDCPAHTSAPNDLLATTSDPFHARAKSKIKQMAASAHRKTDGKPLSEAHQQYLQGVTEDKLRLAYELDPSNYTNYGNYHLFIATTTYGKSEGDDDAAVALARRTLEFCKQDASDPASWITAASAAYNIIYHIGRYYHQYSVSEAKSSLAEFDYCIGRYLQLRREAMELGRLIPGERIKEMDERARYLSALRKAQGVYMKRVMTTKMANSSIPLFKID